MPPYKCEGCTDKAAEPDYGQSDRKKLNLKKSICNKNKIKKGLDKMADAGELAKGNGTQKRMERKNMLG